MRGQRGGDTQFDTGGFQIAQIVKRAGFGFDRGGIGDAGHVVPFLHELFGRVCKAEACDGVFGDLAELHGGNFGHVVGRHFDSALVQEVDVDLVPDSHGV